MYSSFLLKTDASRFHPKHHDVGTTMAGQCQARPDDEEPLSLSATKKGMNIYTKWQRPRQHEPHDATKPAEIQPQYRAARCTTPDTIVSNPQKHHADCKAITVPLCKYLSHIQSCGTDGWKQSFSVLPKVPSNG